MPPAGHGHRLKGAVSAALATLLAFVGIVLAAPPALSGELLQNGSFDGGTLQPWWSTENTAISVQNGRLRADAPGGTANVWDAMAGQSGIGLDSGAAYTLSFDASAAATTRMHARVQQESAPYTGVLDREITLGTTAEHFTFPFTSSLTADNGQVLFQLGGSADDTTVYLDNISLTTGGGAGNPLEMTDGFYVDPNSNPAEWVRNHPDDPRASIIQSEIASEPMARWFGDWPEDPLLEEHVGEAAQARKLPILVAYNMLDRDCSGPSKGGADTAAEYRSWISGIAERIGTRPAILVLEPDAVAQLDCLSEAGRETRLGLLAYATRQLQEKAPNTWTYVDAGNAGWIAADEMARRLRQAGLENVRGFAVNVSNFYTTAQSIEYAEKINAELGRDVPFVVDTSRNGNGSNDQWCNPPGRRLGTASQVGGGAEMLLWIKVPGDSDGNTGEHCDPSMPDAGTFDPDLALELIGRTPGDPPQPSGCGTGCTTIWPNSTVPATPAGQDTQATELGVKFRVKVPGEITGIRFYKGPGNGGTHVGSLWTSDGTRLASVAFTDETATGWQQATLDAPVAVTPGTTYVASYHAPQGHYALATGYFTGASAGTGPVKALASGIDGANGVYAYTASPAFPTRSHLDRNYWVDVMFRPNDGSSDPPAEFPTPSTTGVPEGTELTTHNGDYHADTPGEVIDGARITGRVFATADNVTIRNSEIHRGVTTFYAGEEGSFTLTDSTIGPPSGCISNIDAAVSYDHYTARRVHVRNFSDAFRNAGDDIRIEDSYVKLCSNPGDHSDGIQAHHGGANVVIRHNTIDQRGVQEHNAPVFWADESQGSILRDNLLAGGTYTVRLHGTGFTFSGNKIVDNAWQYGPVASDCDGIGWSDNHLVTIDAEYRITSITGTLACS